MKKLTEQEILLLKPKDSTMSDNDFVEYFVAHQIGKRIMGISWPPNQNQIKRIEIPFNIK